MDGFDVISVNDDKCIGRMAGQIGDYLIVEHGTLRKRRSPLPLSFATVDDANGRVVTTLSHDIVYDAPPVKDGRIDEDAVALHYGLSETVAEGYGDLAGDELGLRAEAPLGDREPERAPETGEAWET